MKKHCYHVTYLAENKDGSTPYSSCDFERIGKIKTFKDVRDLRTDIIEMRENYEEIIIINFIYLGRNKISNKLDKHK